MHTDLKAILLKTFFRYFNNPRLIEARFCSLRLFFCFESASLDTLKLE